MFQSPVFSINILEILNRCIIYALYKISPRVSHTWKTFLREKCVYVKLLSISFSFHPLHRLEFSDVPQSRFQSRDLGNPQQVHSFGLSKMSSRVFYVGKIFVRKKRVDARSLSISCPFLVLRHLAFSDIPLSRFQSCGILEMLNRCKVSKSVKCPCGCLTSGQYFKVKCAWM